MSRPMSTGVSPLLSVLILPVTAGALDYVVKTVCGRTHHLLFHFWPVRERFKILALMKPPGLQ